MKHESQTLNEAELVEGLYSFSEIYSKPYIPEKYINEIRNAQILLVPYENFRGRTDYFFPEQTHEIYEIIKEEASKNGVLTEICISDEEYQELELHAETVNIPVIIVTSFAFPIVVNAISYFLIKKLETYTIERNVNVNITITVEDKEGTKTIKYKGDMKHFDDAMKTIKRRLK